MVAFYELGLDRERNGNAAGIFQPYDAFQANDGWVNIAAIGPGLNRLLSVIGLDPNDVKWKSVGNEPQSLEGIEFDAILRGWVAERTVKETVEILNAAQIAATAIMTPKDMAEDPHYEMRNVHIEWEDVNLGRKVKGTGVIPKFSKTPGEIWRGSVPLGYDNESVYEKYLGLSASDLDQLKKDGVI